MFNKTTTVNAELSDTVDILSKSIKTIEGEIPYLTRDQNILMGRIKKLETRIDFLEVADLTECEECGSVVFKKASNVLDKVVDTKEEWVPFGYSGYMKSKDILVTRYNCKTCRLIKELSNELSTL